MEEMTAQVAIHDLNVMSCLDAVIAVVMVGLAELKY